jgi:CBS domain containing-hemolysin-like protein
MNGFFTLAQFALVKVRRSRIDHLAEDGVRTARATQHVLKHLDAYLGATQVGNTVTAIALGWIGEPAVARLFDPLIVAVGLEGFPVSFTVAAIIAFILLTALQIVFGELAPKSLGLARPEAASLVVSPIMIVFFRVTRPFVVFLNGTANQVVRLLGIKPADGEEGHTDDELRMIVAASALRGHLDEMERTIVENALFFGERRVRDLMVPRPDVDILDLDDPVEQNLDLIRATKHTRYPVCRGGFDNITGYIHTKDLSAPDSGGTRPDLNAIRREVLVFPESASAEHALREFQRMRQHLGVVVDEFGNMAGIITLEDLVEDLIGEIQDEFDHDERAPLERLPDGTLSVEGAFNLEDLEDALGFDLPASVAATTVGGYVFAVIGERPSVGDTTRIGPYQATVSEVDGLRITRVSLQRSEGAARPAPRA